MGYYISRQRDYKDGGLYIEIAVGGKTKAGKDILTPRYEGELKNLIDPRDALSAAVNIHSHWDRDYGDEKKKLRVVGGATTFSFEFSTKGIAAAKSWADKIYSGMEKCGHCNKAMGKRDPYSVDDIPNAVFCTEVCCARKYRDMFGVEVMKINSKSNPTPTVKKKP